MHALVAVLAAGLPLGLLDRHLADAVVGRLVVGAGHHRQPIEKARVGQRLGADQIEHPRPHEPGTLDDRQNQGGRVPNRDGLQAIRPVPRALDLARGHGVEQHRHEGVAGPDDVGGAEHHGVAARPEERHFGRELREEIRVRAARRQAVARHPEAGEVDDPRDAGGPRGLDHLLGAGHVHRVVGGVAPLGPDLRKVHDGAAAFEGTGEGQRIPWIAHDRAAAGLAHHAGRRPRIARPPPPPSRARSRAWVRWRPTKPLAPVTARRCSHRPRVLGGASFIIPSSGFGRGRPLGHHHSVIQESGSGCAGSSGTTCRGSWSG